MSVTLTPVNQVTKGTIVLGGPDAVLCEVLRDPEHAIETVMPLAGRAMVRLWVRRVDGLPSDGGKTEGYLDYGPSALVHVWTH